MMFFDGFVSAKDIGWHPITFPFYEGYKNAQITFAPVRIRVEEFGALFSGFWLLLLTLSWSLGAAVVLVPSLRARYSAH